MHSIIQMEWCTMRLSGILHVLMHSVIQMEWCTVRLNVTLRFLMHSGIQMEWCTVRLNGILHFLMNSVIQMEWCTMRLNGILHFLIQPASVVQLDARPTGDQEVTGSTPAGSATFFRGDFIMKYFLRSFSPSADSRRAGVISGERMCTILVNRLED